MKSIRGFVALAVMAASTFTAQAQDEFFLSEQKRMLAPYGAANQPQAWWDTVWAPVWLDLIDCSGLNIGRQLGRNPKVSFEAAHAAGVKQCGAQMAALVKVYEPLMTKSQANQIARDSYARHAVPTLKRAYESARRGR